MTQHQEGDEEQSCHINPSVRHGYLLLDRLPLPRQPLRLGDLGRGHQYGETDDRQHEGDVESESERHGSLAGRRIVGEMPKKAQ